eukprot:1148522-Pelagomonas_calceolata.AAC.1
MSGASQDTRPGAESESLYVLFLTLKDGLDKMVQVCQYWDSRKIPPPANPLCAFCGNKIDTSELRAESAQGFQLTFTQVWFGLVTSTFYFSEAALVGRHSYVTLSYPILSCKSSSYGF